MSFRLYASAKDGLEDDDEQLLNALASNTDGAWDRFFAKYDSLVTAVVAWPKWQFDAERRKDVAQAVRIEIFNAARKLDKAKHLAAFVRKIAVHRCIDHLRRQIKDERRLTSIMRFSGDGDEEYELPLPTDPDDDPARIVMAAELGACLRNVLARLDEVCAQGIRDFYVKGRSYKEMAGDAGISINTVGTRLSRCLNKLKTIMRGDPAFRELTENE